MRLGWLWRSIVDFCYPQVCALCGSRDGDGLPVCRQCLGQLRGLQDAPACSLCAMPLTQPDAPCPRCLGRGIRPYARVARLGMYKDPLREIIRRIKYKGYWTLAEFLADRLAEHAAAAELLERCDLLVPVPLHPWRQMLRGFNQAEVLARRLSKLKKIPLARPLVRVKNTPTQTVLRSRVARWKNLRDAFGLWGRRAVQGRHVVVVDDVMTTGATLCTAGRTLQEAEPASLNALVIAVSDPLNRDFEMI